MDPGWVPTLRRPQDLPTCADVKTKGSVSPVARFKQRTREAWGVNAAGTPSQDPPLGQQTHTLAAVCWQAVAGGLDLYAGIMWTVRNSIPTLMIWRLAGRMYDT